MQRSHGASCTSAVNNNGLGAASARDTRRPDSSSIGNCSLNSRRPLPLTPYKLKCEKDGLNSRLGPPNFHPPTTSSPEENLTKEYVQFGYKETVEGLEEAKEITLSQVHIFSKPVVLRCKEAVRKCLRAINESRAQKRKAGQVYGVPLSGSLLCKPGFPEQSSCGEEIRRKWIESLSQQHKRLRSLADHIPHGYRRKSLFEVLVKNNVPLLRATWFVKVTYLNQVRPASTALSSGAPDKSQFRCELWTKDVIDYLQFILDELLSWNKLYTTPHTRSRSPQMQKISKASAAIDGEEPSPHFKWWYMVRLLQWHHAEGLLLPNLVIDWVLKLLQETEVFEILQLLLPVVYGVIESIVLSQTYVHRLVAIAVRFIQEPSPGGSDLVDNSRRAYIISALIEMVHYLILAVPDTFVALDCYPLPPSVASYRSKDNMEKLKSGSAEASSLSQFEFLSFDYIISTIQASADDLSKAVSFSSPQHNMAKAVQALNKALLDGDIRAAYCHLFEDVSNGVVDDSWVTEVSPCLRSSLRCVGAVSSSFACSIFFLLEWATCDSRDFQIGVPRDVDFTGGKDHSHVYLVIQLLKSKIRGVGCRKNHRNNFPGYSRSTDVFESPGPLHDIIVCWIDQHEVHKGGGGGGGAKRLQLLIFELIRSGIFYPIAYARQLIVSGMIDAIQPAELERRMRHYRVLKQLPGFFIRETLEEEWILGGAEIAELVKKFSNERRLLLRELQVDRNKYLNNMVMSDHSSEHNSNSPASVGFSRKYDAMTDVVIEKRTKNSVDIQELKELISALLRFPGMASGVTDSTPGDSQGSVKRSNGSVCSKMDEATSRAGCEDCNRVKRPRLNDEKSSCIQGDSPIVSDEEEEEEKEEDNWWTWKGSRTSGSFSKVEQVPVPRGRQKIVRKTQLLTQLQEARIEGSQGASTSHVCDLKVSCPHHGPSVEAERHKVVEAVSADVVSIGNSLKQLRFVEKRSITVWLTTVVRQLVEESRKNVLRDEQSVRGSATRWQFGEDELSAIIHLMDASLDLVSAVKFLLWLLPKTSTTPSFTVQGGRKLVIGPVNLESHACEVGEAFLVSSLRRYENILLSAELVPEALSALMTRAALVMSSNGRVPNSAALIYARCLLKRHGSLPSVVEWRKKFKETCDKRLLLSELDDVRGDGEYGAPLGVPAGVNNPDDYLRQKISATRLSRAGLNMRELVQKHVEQAASHYLRKLNGTGAMKNSRDDGYQIAQEIVIGLMDCIRQTGGAAQEGDPSLVSSAVSAIIASVGFAIARISDFSVGNTMAEFILQIHITSLFLLKEALGERQSRVFEIAVATESSSALAGQVVAPGKASRSSYQLSPESYDLNPITTTERQNRSNVVFSKATKVTAAVSALVVGVVTRGVITLERMVGLLRLRESLDFVQFVKSTKSSSNGSARSTGAFKAESSIEVYVHWFRLLVGNCKSVSEGLVAELIGEPSVVAISRMQRMLPLNLVFPPAYAIFAFVLWGPLVLNGSSGMHDEDTNRLYQSSKMAINDVIKHLPFRDVCLRDSRGLYDLMVADPTDAELASVLELNGFGMRFKSITFVPLRARLFLNALIDSKMPPSGYTQEGDSEAGIGHHMNVTKFQDKLISVLDSLEPAKFHWQWVELRLLLNEEALIDKLENHNMSLAEAIRSSCPSSEQPAASENEKTFIQFILTRLLVRPDAVSLFSELVHLLGRSVEDSMLKQAEWLIGGQDVLLGRKTIKQKLVTLAEDNGHHIKTSSLKPCGVISSSEKKKMETSCIEEGEVIEEVGIGHEVTIDKAFVQLVLPCIDHSSVESQSIFLNELVKQFDTIEEQISSVCSSNKQTRGSSSVSEISSSSRSGRKGPTITKRSSSVASEGVLLPSPGALRASLSLRLQFLLRLLPVICGGPSNRSIRHSLASSIIRLLGSRVLYEDSRVCSPPFDPSAVSDPSSEALFDKFLLVLHGLFSIHQPRWLSRVPASKLLNRSPNDFSPFDPDLAQSLQKEVEKMQLPDSVRRRIQAAMPILLVPSPSPRCSLSCHPVSAPVTSRASLNPSSPATSSTPPSRHPKTGNNNQVKMKQTQGPQHLPQEVENSEIDPWMLLEDGTGSGPSSKASSNSDHNNLRAASWLKGAVRIRRTSLTYIGNVDNDS